MPAVTSKRIKAFNPQRGVKKHRPAKKAAAGKKRKSNNPPGLMTLGFALGNPQKEKSMKKKNSKKAAPKSKKPSTKKAKNPSGFGYKKAPAKKHGKASNPSFLRKPIDNVKFGAAALVGLAAARQLPQLALKEANSGWLGYAANLAVATLGGIGIGMANKQLGYAFGLGGGMYFVARFLTEKASPVGKYLALAGVGDAAAAGMGDLQDGYFPVPVITDSNGQPMIPEAILRAAVGASLNAMDVKQRAAAAAAPAPQQLSGMPLSGVPSRFRR